MLSLAIINILFEKDPYTVSGSLARKLLSSIRGRGMIDPVGQAKNTTSESSEVD